MNTDDTPGAGQDDGLKAERDWLQQRFNGAAMMIDDYEQRLSAVTADRDRLKAALEQIAKAFGHAPSALSRWATEALSGEQAAAAPEQSLQQEVVAWAGETFPGSTQRAKLLHMQEESIELSKAIADECGPDDIAAEIADIFLIGLHWAEAEGRDLMADIRAKFEKCKLRTWGEPDAAGVVQDVAAPGQAKPAIHRHVWPPDGKHGGLCLLCGMTRDEVTHPAPGPVPAPESTDEYLARLREFHEASGKSELLINSPPLHIRATYQPGGPVPTAAPPAPCTLHSWPHDDSPDARCMVCGVTRRVAHEARELIKMWQTAGWLFVYNIAEDAFATMIAGNGNPPIDSPQALAAVTAWMRAQKERQDG